MKHFFLLLFSFGYSLSAGAGESQKFCGLTCSAADQALKDGKSMLQKLNSIDAFAEAPVLSCAKNLVASENGDDLALGARKAMALAYGSCEVLKVKALSALPGSKNPYQSIRFQSGCSDVNTCEHPQSLNACAQKSCEVLRNHSPVSHVNAAEYVTQSMMAMGLRPKPNQDFQSASPKLNEYWSFGEIKRNQPQDCFDRVLSEGGIQAGDLLVSPGNQVVIIDTVGGDPFGLSAILRKSNQQFDDDYRKAVHERGTRFGPFKSKAKLEAAEQINLQDVLTGRSKAKYSEIVQYLDDLVPEICDANLDPRSYQITIAQASPEHGLGVQRDKADAALKNVSGLNAGLNLKAQAECVRTLKRNLIARVQAQSNSHLPVQKIKDALSKDGPFLGQLHCEETGLGDHCPKTTRPFPRVLRFAGSRTGCRKDPSFIAPNPSGNSCADCCDTRADYQTLVGETDAAKAGGL
jgi:hypothetical protein